MLFVLCSAIKILNIKLFSVKFILQPLNLIIFLCFCTTKLKVVFKSVIDYFTHLGVNSYFVYCILEKVKFQLLKYFIFKLNCHCFYQVKSRWFNFCLTFGFNFLLMFRFFFLRSIVYVFKICWVFFCFKKYSVCIQNML